MDYEMPLMNGPQTTQCIRELGYTEPIIGVSGNVLPDDVQHFKASGATAVLAKPVRIEQLDNLIGKSNC